MPLKLGLTRLGGFFLIRAQRLGVWTLMAAVHSVLLFGSSTGPVYSPKVALEEQERHIWKYSARPSQFNNVPHAGNTARCEEVQPPEALTTPRPLMMPVPPQRTRVKVSFIIGTDGRVHSPLILESAGPMGDRSVLSAVRYWRFRPATCNGVPTEIEGKFEFSSR